MPYIVPSREETREDQRLYTRARLVEVRCQDCLARVGVKKNSEHHTSIQWTSEAFGHCLEFTRMADQPGGRPVRTPCSRLVGSIEAAVRNGQVTVGAEDGY